MSSAGHVVVLDSLKHVGRDHDCERRDHPALQKKLQRLFRVGGRRRAGWWDGIAVIGHKVSFGQMSGGDKREASAQPRLRSESGRQWAGPRSASTKSTEAGIIGEPSRSEAQGVPSGADSPCKFNPSSTPSTLDAGSAQRMQGGASDGPIELARRDEMLVLSSELSEARRAGRGLRQPPAPGSTSSKSIERIACSTMQLTRLAVQPDAIPVKDAIGGVGVLLDLENDVAGADGVQAAAGQVDGVAGLRLDPMQAIGHGPVADLLLESVAGDAGPQPDERCRRRATASVTYHISDLGSPPSSAATLRRVDGPGRKASAARRES